MMPRRRADKVIEHRISLSDGLHKEVKQVIASNKISSQVSMVGNGAKSVMNVAAVGALGAVAYLGVKAYAEAKGVSEQIKGALNKAWDWGFGVETNADGSLVPTTVTTTDAWGNEKVVVNRINEVPVLGRVWPIGGLFQWGMELGAANNPFSGDPAPPPPPPPPRHDADEIYEQYLRDEYYAEYGHHEYDAEEAWRMNQEASEAAAAAHAKWVEDNNITPSDIVGDFFEEGEGDYVLIPDDSRRIMTRLEWGVWAFRNGDYGKRNDMTDSGLPINSTMTYRQYQTWYGQNVTINWSA